MPDDEERRFWIRRLEATGKAQARYLWLLLVAGLFFGALRARGSGTQAIRVPVVDLELDGATVLAAGAPIMAFLVLAVLGAIRAWTSAVEEIREAKAPQNVEPLDTYPTAIDMALYTTERSPRYVRNVLSFAYPLYLTGGVAESAWLRCWARRTPPFSGSALFAVVLAITWIPAAILVLDMWLKRAARIWNERSSA